MTLRANNGAITDFNSIANNVTNAFRVDFNDGSTTNPAGVGTNAEAIEVANLGTGGVTAQTSGGGIFIDNTAGAFAISGIAHNGSAGDISITSSTAVKGGITTLSANNGNVSIGVTGAALDIQAPINKGASGSLVLSTTGSTSDIIIGSNVIGNANNVTLQSGGSITSSGAFGVSGAALSLLSGGNILGNPASFSITGTTTLSAPASGTITLTSAGNSFGGAVTVNGGSSVSLNNSGNLTIASASQAAILSLTSTSGAVNGSGIGGTQLNATAAAGISMTGVNTPVTVNLANTTSGDITYNSTVGGGMTLAVTATNSAVGGKM